MPIKYAHIKTIHGTTSKTFAKQNSLMQFFSFKITTRTAHIRKQVLPLFFSIGKIQVQGLAHIRLPATFVEKVLAKIQRSWTGWCCKLYPVASNTSLYFCRKSRSQKVEIRSVFTFLFQTLRSQFWIFFLCECMWSLSECSIPVPPTIYLFSPEVFKPRQQNVAQKCIYNRHATDDFHRHSACLFNSLVALLLYKIGDGISSKFYLTQENNWRHGTGCLLTYQSFQAPPHKKYQQQLQQ